MKRSPIGRLNVVLREWITKIQLLGHKFSSRDLIIDLQTSAKAAD